MSTDAQVEVIKKAIMDADPNLPFQVGPYYAEIYARAALAAAQAAGAIALTESEIQAVAGLDRWQKYGGTGPFLSDVRIVIETVHRLSALRPPSCASEDKPAAETQWSRESKRIWDEAPSASAPAGAPAQIERKTQFRADVARVIEGWSKDHAVMTLDDVYDLAYAIANAVPAPAGAPSEADVKRFADELRNWWSFDDRQHWTHSWHDRENFIEKKLPALLALLQQSPKE